MKTKVSILFHNKIGMDVKCWNIYEEEMKRASSLSLRGVDGVVGATGLNPFFSWCSSSHNSLRGIHSIHPLRHFAPKPHKAI